jgi:glucose-6-phosphate-specific signal transduction histidine kinase
MSSAALPIGRRPNPVLVVIRVIVVAIAFGVLGGGVGGLMGIVGVSIINLAGIATDMYMALFAGVIPGALIGLTAGLGLIIRSERQHVRQQNAEK